MVTSKLNYTDAELQTVIMRLARAGRQPVDVQLVRNNLLDLLAIPDADDEFTTGVDEISRSEPGHGLLADVYKRVRGREIIALRKAGPEYGRRVATVLSAELRQKVRRRGLPHHAIKVRYAAADLSLKIAGFECQKDLLDEICAELELFHQKSIRQGRAQHTKLDTLLYALADIFVDATGLKLDPIDLPHGNRSHFIQFASASLLPFIRNTEVEPLALGKRWDRMKRHHSTAL